MLKRYLCMLLSVLILFSVAFQATVFADEFDINEEIFFEENYFEPANDDPGYVEENFFEDEYIFLDEPTEEWFNEYSEEEPLFTDELIEEWPQEFIIEEDTSAEIIAEEPYGEEKIVEFEIADNETFESAGTMNITVQPDDCEAAVGSNATFTVEATGVASYQWQYWTPNSNKWSNNSGDAAKTASFSIEATNARYSYKYRCMLTGTDGSTLYTEEVQIVKPESFEIITQPVDCEAAVGSNATFTVEATGVASYQWQYSMNNGTKWYDNSGDAAKTASFSIETTERRYDYIYRCVLTGKDGSTLYTDTVKIVPDVIVIENVTYRQITPTTCIVVSYSGSAISLTIDETVNGMTVTEIGEEAFMNNTTLETIDLPDTITIIHARAFKGCTNLREMR